MALGEQRFYGWIRRFGFGERAGLPLPGEQSGLLHRADKWTQVSPASISIGQEIAVTPLQITRAVASVATGGMLVEPRIVKRIVDEQGNTVLEPPRGTSRRVMSEKTAAVLNEILKAVVSRGTGEKAAIAEHVVAGKTGTAQKAVRGKRRGDVGFVSASAADQPPVILVVTRTAREHYGGTGRAGFREVAATLRYLGVPPSIPSRTIGVEPPLLAAFSQWPSQAPRQTGPASTVPDLRGLDARAAIARAVASGLKVRAIGSGVVTSQDPAPGVALPPTGG